MQERRFAQGARAMAGQADEVRRARPADVRRRCERTQRAQDRARSWARSVLATWLCLVPLVLQAEDRWQRLDAFLTQSTSAAGYPGAVAVVEVDGKPVFQGAYGHRDLARTRPMRADAIFRVYSMTKPVATVAVLTLMDQGKLALDDPLSRYLPAFAQTQVVVGGDLAQPRLAPVRRPITLRHLLTHTSGLAADATRYPVATGLLEQAGVEQARDLADVAGRLARVPLATQPGTEFNYEGANTELLARVVEVVSGETFSHYLQAHVLGPLGMRDTGFEVPAAQRGRVVDLPTLDDHGALRIADTPSARQPGARLRAYDSAAGGLYSTAGDYLRFARMLLNDGASGGVRVLSRKTVELMTRDQLGGFDPPVKGLLPGEGFGLGGYVVTDPAARGRLGSVGQFGWSGAASTYFTVDRKAHLVAVLLLQYLPADRPGDLPKLATPFYNLVYQALP
ncbi:class A beta-lactamase-related serine hydrolase [Pseudoxanthomonas winnipegensis]|uniref:Class A beta-lactamase-related serine hydrolase n=1 Tax=Pseudoxanthomonas winnipegensis TaxID=2480810 RepID=A0A4Q8M4E9_9GAMM|nr:class A beta-lactamase-related serine hydrolase [Pseudoxanthomonas winnipegensis]